MIVELLSALVLPTRFCKSTALTLDGADGEEEEARYTAQYTLPAVDSWAVTRIPVFVTEVFTVFRTGGFSISAKLADRMRRAVARLYCAPASLLPVHACLTQGDTESALASVGARIASLLQCSVDEQGSEQPTQTAGAYAPLAALVVVVVVVIGQCCTVQTSEPQLNDLLAVLPFTTVAADVKALRMPRAARGSEHADTDCAVLVLEES